MLRFNVLFELAGANTSGFAFTAKYGDVVVTRDFRVAKMLRGVVVVVVVVVVDVVVVVCFCGWY